MLKRIMSLLLKVLSKFQFLLLLGLFLIGPIAHADTDTTTDQDSIQEDHDTKNLDKLLINYNKDQKKVLNDNAKIANEDDASEVSEKELGVTSKKNNFKKVDPKNLKKIKSEEALRIALEPLQKMSEGDLVRLLKENTKDTPGASYISRFPKLSIYTVRLIKDKDALPNLGKIIDNQDEFLHFVAVMLVTIILAFLLKRFMQKTGRPVGAAVGFWFLRFFIISSLRFGVFVYFYSNELSPIFSIAIKTFF